ncbi:MAG: hypothetical protein IKY72_04855 [Bacteroidaceae bacterium]|nr:hypothetical protein [Bacteroidaceae bacterium]
MKAIGYLIIMEMLLLSACNGASGLKKRYAPNEEQYVAHEYLTKANNVSTDDNEQRMLLFDKAIYHFANIVVRSDANDTLRADALFTLRWIEAYVKHDYEQALQYLNQYLELVGPEHESYPTCLAYKADDLWHFGAQDSALHYAYLALEAPHTPNDAIEYICHHILWNIYDSREMPDSASRHKALHMKIRESRVFEPMTMEQLKSQLQANVIAPTSKRTPLIPIVTIAVVLIVGLYVAYLTYKCRRHAKPTTPVAKNTPTKAEILSNALVQGSKAFALTSVYDDIATMQINERELPNLSYETARAMERTLLDAFGEACRTLLANGDLNDQELICALGMYLGYSNAILAHLGHTTTATIRKRKERIRKKLPAEFCDVICSGKRQE